MIRRRSLYSRALLPLAGTLIALLASTAVVSAHEHRHIGGYELTVGFLVEPAIVEEPNGLSLRVVQGEGESATPVEGLAETLKAEIVYGDQVMPLELRAAFGEPGSYKADVIPTAEGAYTFHIFGTIEGTAIDERFTSGPDTFSEVESRSTMTFPADVQPISAVAGQATAASDRADTAMLLAIGGIVVGALGLAAGVAGLLAARNARSQPRASASVMQHEPGD